MIDLKKIKEIIEDELKEKIENIYIAQKKDYNNKEKIVIKKRIYYYEKILEIYIEEIDNNKIIIIKKYIWDGYGNIRNINFYTLSTKKEKEIREVIQKIKENIR